MDEAEALLDRLYCLSEAGRMLSAPNLAAIKAAVDALQVLVTRAEGGDKPDDAQAKKATEAARELLEADLSFDDTTNALRSALKAANPASKRSYYWIRDTFEDWFVYEDDPELGGVSKLYKRTYVIADDGKVTLGDPVEVVRRTVYDVVGAQATEAADLEVAGDYIPLVEKAVRRDSTVAVKLIQPGWGSSGYYGAEMLERDGPKVFAKGTKMFWDHPTAAEEAERPEGSLRHLAAELISDARWEPKGTAGAGLYADAKVFGPYKEAVEELAPHIGVSIRALGKGRDGVVDGRKGKVIESLVGAKSTDFVTAPGAGGQVLSLFESARGRASQPTSEEGQLTEAEAQALRDANDALREANVATVSRMNQLEARLIESDAREYVRAELAKIHLPEAARQRLTAVLVAKPPIKDGALDTEALAAQVKEAAAAEATYIGQVAGSGAIRGMGSAGEAAPMTVEESAASLEASFRKIGLSESVAKIAAGGRV